jgi:hypothetical protein
MLKEHNIDPKLFIYVDIHNCVIAGDLCIAVISDMDAAVDAIADYCMAYSQDLEQTNEYPVVKGQGLLP